MSWSLTTHLAVCKRKITARLSASHALERMDAPADERSTYRRTLRKSLSPTERTPTLIDYLPREVRDIALSYSYSKYGETALDVPFTRQEFRQLLKETGKVSIAYFYRSGCRVNSWRVVEKSTLAPTTMFDPVMTLYKSAAVGDTLAPAFAVATREYIAAELEKNPPRVEPCAGKKPLRSDVLSAILLDVASMFRLFRRRAESFPSPVSLARWRTQKFLDEVNDCYHSDPALLEQYLRESAIVIGLEVPVRGEISLADAITVLDTIVRDAMERTL